MGFLPFIKCIFYQTLTLQLWTSYSISISLSYHRKRLYLHNRVTVYLGSIRSQYIIDSTLALLGSVTGHLNEHVKEGR